MPYLSTPDLLNKIFDGKSFNVSETVDTAPVYGAKTVGTAGASESLSTDTIEHVVYVKAMQSNSGNIYIGDSGVSSANGFPLAAGEQIALQTRDLNKIYLDTDTGGEGVKYIGV